MAVCSCGQRLVLRSWSAGYGMIRSCKKAASSSLGSSQRCTWWVRKRRRESSGAAGTERGPLTNGSWPAASWLQTRKHGWRASMSTPTPGSCGRKSIKAWSISGKHQWLPNQSLNHSLNHSADHSKGGGTGPSVTFLNEETATSPVTFSVELTRLVNV